MPVRLYNNAVNAHYCACAFCSKKLISALQPVQLANVAGAVPAKTEKQKIQ